MVFKIKKLNQSILQEAFNYIFFSFKHVNRKDKNFVRNRLKKKKKTRFLVGMYVAL